MNVLVIDDNEADQFLSEYAIEQNGADIVINKAYDGKEALEFLQSCELPPAILFLDLNMPGMNGFDFLEAYQTHCKDKASVIVILTSSIRDDDYQQCIAYPQVKEVLTKPLGLEAASHCINLYRPTNSA